MLQPLIARVGKVELKRHSVEVASGRMLMQEHVLMCMGMSLRRDAALNALGQRLTRSSCKRRLVEASSSTNATSYPNMLNAEPLMPSLC
jgi:hypothetical protein